MKTNKRKWRKIRKKYRKGLKHIRKATKKLKPRGQTKKKMRKAYGFSTMPPRKKISKRLF